MTAVCGFFLDLAPKKNPKKNNNLPVVLHARESLRVRGVQSNKGFDSMGFEY